MDGIRWDKGLDPIEAKRQGPIQKEKTGGKFHEILEESLREVNELQNKADKAIMELAKGESQDLHQTMILMEKAELSLKLMVQVRNRLLEAYQEIMRMPV